MAGTLTVGDTFESYQLLHQAVVQYGNANCVQYWKRDTRRLRRATPKIYEIAKLHPELEYCSIRFSCIHGGQAFRPKVGFSDRKRRGTWKQDCKAEILVGLNDHRDRLIIRKIVDEHNHEIPSEEVFKQLPKNKRNTLTETETARSGQPPMPRSPDSKRALSNIVRSNSLARSNNFKKLANVLVEKHECTVDLQPDDGDRIVGFFFQDGYMLRYFETFPEILFVDGTYRLQNINCSVYVMSAENSVGDTEVVAVAVSTLEDKDSANWVMERFKDRNPKWESVSIVVTDRLTSQYGIIEDHFPGVRKLICLSHAVHTFKKDATPSKLSVTISDSEKSHDFFTRLTRAGNEEEYRMIWEEMEDTVAYPIVRYFVKNWQDLRSEWVRGLNATVRSCVNGRLDTPNSKLKSTIANCKTFGKFVENLFLVLEMKRNDSKCTYSRMMAKNQIHVHSESPLKEYSQHLTRYATDRIKSIIAELDSDANKISFDGQDDDSDVICHSQDGAYIVSEISCNCDSFTLMKLPCVHLLAYRKSKGLDLFDKYLFSERWTKKYLLNLWNVGTIERAGPPTDKSLGEKYEEAQSLCLSLAGLCSEVDGDRFASRIEVLGKLREFWTGGDEVLVQKALSVNLDHDYLKMEED